MEAPKQTQRDITMFTVKKSPGQGLRLTLTRDPRSLTAKLPSKPSPKLPSKTFPKLPTSPFISSPASAVDASEESIPSPGVGNQLSASEPPSRSMTDQSSASVQPRAKGMTGRSSSKRQQTLLPVSRVKTVMKTNVKSSQYTLSGYSQESVMVVTKATVSRTPFLTARELIFFALISTHRSCSSANLPRMLVKFHRRAQLKKSHTNI